MSSHEILALLGALSGAGSAAAAVYFVKIERKRAEEECQKRFEALREGMKIEREKQ